MTGLRGRVKSLEGQVLLLREDFNKLMDHVGDVIEVVGTIAKAKS